MPRKKVTTTYVPAQTTPSERKKKITTNWSPTRSPKGLTPLAQYVLENEGNGIPVSELIEQFQEYDCDHLQMRVISQSMQKVVSVCEGCGITVIELKKER